MPLTKKQQLRISQLVAANRAAGVSCHPSVPTMQALFKYVDGLLLKAVVKERKVHLPERATRGGFGRGRDYDRYVE